MERWIDAHTNTTRCTKITPLIKQSMQGVKGNFRRSWDYLACREGRDYESKEHLKSEDLWGYRVQVFLSGLCVSSYS